MLNDQELSRSEAIIFENMENAADRINDLEDLNKDRWATVAYLCEKIKNLEKDNQDVEKRTKLY